MRWRSVKPATSSMLFAAPMTATSTKATIPVGAPASRMIGIPQATSASANGLASRRPAIETAANAPNRPPAPTAALSRPTQPPPASSTWNATTTIRTLSAPRTTVWATISAITTRGPGSVAITRKPPSRSRASAARSRRPGTVIVVTSTVATAYITHAAPNTQPASATATTTPPSSGPANVPRLSSVEEKALAATSSSGVDASEGSSAWFAGRKSVDATAATVASA